jgi:hypothetical protein
MINTLEQDLDLWEVWIEYDQFHPENFGTLYVHGEVTVDKKSASYLTKLNGDEKCQLKLQLPLRSTNVNSTKEVLYSEPIKNLNQYTSISIYAGNELIGYFDHIEVMI